MYSMKKVPRWSAKESRFLHRGNISQFGRDTRDFHIRADGPLETMGAPVMTAAAAIAKLPNAIVGSFSPEEAIPLGEGGLKYTALDIKSIGGNAVGAMKNLLTLHPVKALGNVVAGTFDALDVVTVDPLLDVGSGVFGHQQKVRRGMNAALTQAA